MLTLFNIQEQYRQIANILIDNDGELTPELEEALQLNKEQLQEKAINYGHVINQANAEVDMLSAEIERLTKLKKSREKMADLLKQKIAEAMREHGIEKIDSPFLKLSFRKSEVLVVDDNFNDLEYMIPQGFKIDKIKLKQDIKNGQSFVDAHIEVKYNLQVK